MTLFLPEARRTRRRRGAPCGGDARPCAARTALTLLELVVVLAILAVLAAVAVQTTNQAADQARYDSTVRTLTELKGAIVGPDPSSLGDANSGAACFVADMGRAPASLEELLTQPVGAPDFAIAAATATADEPNHDLLLPRGWRGPYFRLPLGATTLRDGWGAPFEFLYDAATDTLTIVSYGANRLPDDSPDVAGFDRDLVVTIAPRTRTGDVVGQIYQTDANGVRTAPAAGTTLAVLGVALDDAASVHGLHLRALEPTAVEGAPSTYRVTNPVGPCILRATIGEGEGARYVTKNVTLRSGEVLTIDFDLTTPD